MPGNLPQAVYCSVRRFKASQSLTRSFASSSRWYERKEEQPHTTASDNITLKPPAAYISHSHDPWFNLSYEDWLLRNTPPDQPVLFLYRNFRCVVIGRNQNPWKETTPRYLRAESLPLIRRRSGGGTVYHDMGNTNFSIMLPRLLFTRSHGAELVAKAIRDRLGVKACTVNERNDVIIRDEERDFKVSGSAYKIIQHRAYHHGTMLISSSVAELGKALKSQSPGIETKGVASFRSPVTTLNAHRSPDSSPIKHSDFVEAVTREFSAIYAKDGGPLEMKEVSENEVREEKVWNGVEELRSWDWTFGQSPEFSNSFEGDLSIGNISVALTSRHALITSLTLHLTPPRTTPLPDAKTQQDFLDAFALSLVGKRYETLESAEGASGPKFEEAKYRALGDEIISWLRKTM